MSAKGIMHEKTILSTDNCGLPVDYGSIDILGNNYKKCYLAKRN